METSSFAEVALDNDSSPQRFDDALHDGQAEAQPCLGESPPVSAETNGSNMRSRTSAGIPGPRSRMLISHSPYRHGRSYVHDRAAGEAWMALTIRLNKICCRLPSWALTVNPAEWPQFDRDLVFPAERFEHSRMSRTSRNGNIDQLPPRGESRSDTFAGRCARCGRFPVRSAPPCRGRGWSSGTASRIRRKEFLMPASGLLISWATRRPCGRWQPVSRLPPGSSPSDGGPQPPVFAR